ncbi:MAG: pyridoxal phosphate-dependent aminotransferase [Bacillota bacterium]|uniref:pyridoxal phosphate-dependent aminotransferase n=1 Tax=Desulfurispora thermophila TaxID=265470 RepID=UPI0003750321|nr:pyridoxal phosphate-dependent aminotransferase [Desulfurispora thermophila]
MAISKEVEQNLTRASWIRKMFEEGERLRAIHGPDKVFDFTLGNPNVEPPARFHTELRKIAEKPLPGMHRYMSNAGYPETRAAIATVLAEDSKLPFTEKHIVMTVGAGGGLNVVLKTLLDPGDEVIVLKPYFVEYRFYIANHQGVTVEVATDQYFLPDFIALEQAINKNTKAIIINSPNNPTGVVYDENVLRQLGQLLNKKQQELQKEIYLISDEPYAKIVYENTKVPSVFSFYSNSIMVTSHSKDLALPGERIGYIAVSPQASGLELLIEGLVFANRVLGFVNAPALMQHLVKHLQRETVNIAEYQEKRDILYNHLTGLGFQMVKPMGAFYLFPRSPLPDEMEFVRLAQTFNILVVPGSGFGMPGYFRLSYCVDKQIILNSLPAFTALAQKLGLPA